MRVPRTHGPSAARWAAGPTRAHGLGDRVAAPQMFLSPDGRRLYNYGGWTSRGPQTDLAVSSADAYEAFACGAVVAGAVVAPYACADGPALARAEPARGARAVRGRRPPSEPSERLGASNTLALPERAEPSDANLALGKSEPSGRSRAS